MATSMQDTGIPVGQAVPQATFTNWDGKSVELNGFTRTTAIFFISVYCSHCIDFIPSISDIVSEYDLDAAIFSTGDNEDHEEMAEFLEWHFPVISLESELMEETFNVTYLPYVLIVDASGTVLNKGVVYTKDDFQFIMQAIMPLAEGM